MYTLVRQFILPIGLDLGLLECISCILEHGLGFLNTTLISLNFGFLVYFREST